jgi:alcohol dehydrogenase class IV
MIHQLLMPNKILYGAGSFASAGQLAKELGSHVLIVSDPIMKAIGNIERCADLMIEESLACTVYAGVDSEPTDKHVDEALALCREQKCDVIVALGGGSAIDTAKAVAVMITNPGYIGDYRGTSQRFSHKALPLIAVPTTAGTGSEVTKVTVITDTTNEIKMMISQPELLPAAAIVDPELTLSCPPAVTAATGVDALCHAIEAYLSRRAHPVTDNLALSAIEMIMNNLRSSYKSGNDLVAREKVSLAAMLAGAAFSNASVTLVHGMSRPIGALFHVPHGISNAMLLPGVLQFTRDSAIERLASIGRQLKPQYSALSDREMADVAISEVIELCRDLDIPNMEKWGIQVEKFTAVLSKMATDALDSGSPRNNPRIPTQDEIIALYQTCYRYKYS